MTWARRLRRCDPGGGRIEAGQPTGDDETAAIFHGVKRRWLRWMRSHRRRTSSSARALRCGVWLAMVGASLLADAGEAATARTRADEAFRSSRARFQQDRSNVEAGWQFSRACFDLAELAHGNEQTEEIAKQGIEAARRAIARYPDSAEAHYYLALNLGQLARTKSVGALRIVHDIERELKTSIDLDEKFDYAGPHRSLGLLYRDTPGWPASIGSKSKARAELERAVELFPHYPENTLCLAESHAKWGERRALQSEIIQIEGSFPEATKKFAGEAWANDWEEWRARLQKLKKTAEKSSKRTR